MGRADASSFRPCIGGKVNVYGGGMAVDARKVNVYGAESAFLI